MSKKDLTREELYEGVKLMIESQENHIHLHQQKLYTLFSIAFNYLLFQSGKNPGHYIIRIEDSYLLEKLMRKAKDDTSRKFLSKLALPRKFKFEGSMFHLDFFSFTTWANTNDLPKDKIKGALIVKNAKKSPIATDFIDEEDEALTAAMAAMPKNYYQQSLTETADRTVVVAFEEEYINTHPIKFPFIKEESSERVGPGVSIASDINLDDLENS